MKSLSWNILFVVVLIWTLCFSHDMHSSFHLRYNNLNSSTTSSSDIFSTPTSLSSWKIGLDLTLFVKPPHLLHFLLHYHLLVSFHNLSTIKNHWSINWSSFSGILNFVQNKNPGTHKQIRNTVLMPVEIMFFKWQYVKHNVVNNAYDKIIA